jgi:hypothetical protein
MMHCRALHLVMHGSTFLRLRCVACHALEDRYNFNLLYVFLVYKVRLLWRISVDAVSLQLEAFFLITHVPQNVQLSYSG